jgi:3',5'-cyclic AMP phosphodiesterase CpdA
MIKIAHISDIHFGTGFSHATWEQVAKAVIGFDPQLIVVSGDLVDDPSPAHLLAAKCALDDLLKLTRENSTKLGSNQVAEMVVIPGNHDVFVTGVSFGTPRHAWFERMFYGADTAKAEQALKSKLGVESLAFNSVCLGLAPDTRPQDVGRFRRALVRLRGAFSSSAIAPWEKADDFAACLGEVRPLPVVIAPDSAPVLLALLDSNPKLQGYDAATGMVDNDQLMGLQSKLWEKKGVYVARIAVIHHHVLPVAFASDAEKMKGEPLMTLRNAGAVLRTLADHKFDLILHGHWHKPQFARVDFGSDDSLSYPMAVASAGSAAKTSPDPKANSINLITIADTGRIEACSLYYGASQAPIGPNDLNSVAGTHYHLYREPLSAAKRRAYVRARERHVIECKARKQFYEITENGDMWLTHRVEGLRICGDIPIYKQREHSMVIPRHGHFDVDTLDLDEESKLAGVTFSLEPPSADPRDKRRRYWVDLPNGGLKQGESASYGISYGCANSMRMTYWEAAERLRLFPEDRAKEDFDSEWVGIRVTFPTEKLTLSIKQPPSLAALQPYVECRRHPGYPVYEFNKWGDADLNAKMPIDSEAQKEERQQLSYHAPTSTWTLEIDRPLVGYQYALRWKLRDDAPNQKLAGRKRWQRWQRITGETEGWRRALLNLGSRIDTKATGAADDDAIKQFDLLCRTLQHIVCRGGFEEKWTIALFVYDSDKLALRPVLSRHSWSGEQMPRTFEMPYGDGVGGAAFQQRRIVAWSHDPAISKPFGSALITPLNYPPPAEGAVDMKSVLALPVYHFGSEDGRRPSPSLAIGVVTIGSSSYASPIRGMSDKQRSLLRGAAQIQVDHMIRAVMGPTPPSP